jgi:hypothetical protein
LRIVTGELRFTPETIAIHHLALYRDSIEGRAAPAKHRGHWMYPVARLATNVYRAHHRAAA